MIKRMLLGTALIAIIFAGIAKTIKPQEADLTNLLSHLQSTDWKERSSTLNQLISISNVLASQQVKDALIGLLDSENQLINATLIESSGQSGVSDKYGEGYSEYYSKLLGIVKDVADISNDRRALDALAHGSYNPDSPLAQYLISNGETICDNRQPPMLSSPSDVSIATNPNATACGVFINDPTLGSASVNGNCLGVRVTRSGVPANNFFPVGKTTIIYTAIDVLDQRAMATQIVDVHDKTPPSITNVLVSPSSIWPPNHKMVNVTVNYSASDNCDLATQLTNKLSVSSNQGTTADWQIVDAYHVLLRADKGNIYTITITSTDSKGNKASKNVTIIVPHDQRK